MAGNGNLVALFVSNDNNKMAIGQPKLIDDIAVLSCRLSLKPAA